MDLTVLSYVVYLPISTVLTVWVARTLSRNGRIFLADVFKGDGDLADAVNHLLVVGFYLVNLGFVALWMRNSARLDRARDVFDALSLKLGTVLLVLGLLHLANVYVLGRIRQRGMLNRRQQPPVPPQAWVAPSAPQA